MENEPSLDQIDDYNNNESPEKRKTIKLVILFILAVGVVYALVKYNYNTVDEYIGTPEKPGMNVTKEY